MYCVNTVVILKVHRVEIYDISVSYEFDHQYIETIYSTRILTWQWHETL